jgi:Lrp/AsnC family transcriptional regulator, leucine-responsive regulatory protein
MKAIGLLSRPISCHSRKSSLLSEVVLVKRLQYQNGEIDAVDKALLEALIANARISNAELARLVGLSGPSVSERIKRLEEAGVIEGYTAKINPAALGLALSAWLRVRPIPGQLHKVAEILRGLPEVVECDRVTGEDCFIARAHVKSVKDLERLIDEIIPYAMTNTSIIQSSPVRRRLPPIASRMAG